MRFAAPLSPWRPPKRVRIFGLLAAAFLASGVCIPANSGRVLRGTIADATGTAIHDASVTLDAGNNKTSLTETDDAGRFEFAGLAAGIYQLRVQSPGFTTKTITDIGIDHEGVLVLSLTLDASTESDCSGPGEYSDSIYYQTSASHGAHLGGEIAPYPDDISADESITESTVSLYRKGEDRLLQSQHPDKNGKFYFRDVDPGDYVLKASHRDFLEAQSDIFSVQDTGLVYVELFLHKHPHVAPCP